MAKTVAEATDATPAERTTPSHRTRHHGRSTGFHEAVSRHAHHPTHHARHTHPHSHPHAHHAPHRARETESAENSAAEPHPAHAHARTLPPTVRDALDTAMDREAVPAEAWRAGLQFIVAHESGGRVNEHSPTDTARGLFQLTAASYHLNPHGAASFGDAVEEAQGGIRYIRERYGSAETAATFWRRRHWY